MSASTESLQITKDLLRGAIVGLGSYIKPGGVHRCSPGKVYDEVLCNLISSIDLVSRAFELGSSIRRGEMNVASMDLGKLFSNALKEVFRNCNIVHPQYLIPLLVGTLCLGLSGVESILNESAKFKKALELVNSISRWSSIKQYVEALKAVKRDDMYEHLSSLGYTQIGLMQSNVTFNDIYRSLGSRWRGFLLVEVREALIFPYLKKMSDIYKKYRDLALSVIALYMDIIKPYVPSSLTAMVNNVESCGYMSTPECTKLMFELDLALRKSQYSFEWASELVTLTAAFASYEGFK